MKKITLIALLFAFAQFATGQTPCGTISPLDCSEVGVSLTSPFNLTFDGTEGGINTTGFTMVDPPSSPLEADELINDEVIPGLISGNLSVSGGALNVTATNGINFRQLSGSPSSTLTNSQMNALGVGFAASTNVIDVTGTIIQPVFSGSDGNNSQQAGIWLGLNENNFAKLVLVKSSDTAQKVQLAVEQGDGVGNTTNLSIVELNTADFNIAGITSISFRISVDPSDNSVTGFYALNGGAEIQVTGDTDFLTAPGKFITGVDHDSNIATDALTYAGIMTSTRRATGGSLVVSYDSFGVEEILPAPIVPITTPFRMNVAGGDYTLGVDLFEAEDTSYLVGTSDTSTGSYVVVGGNEDLYVPRRFGADFGYAFPITNGDYQVVLHMVENFQTAPNERIFDVIIEDNTVIDDIDLFVTAGEKTPYVESFDVNVADGELNVDFLASIDGGILMGIEILPAAQSDATPPTIDFLSPDDNSISVSVFVVPGAYFNEPIQFVSNPDPVVIWDLTNNIQFEIIDETTGNFSFANGGTTFAFNPDAVLDGNTEYEIRIGANSFQDLDGNAFLGIPSLGWTFTTAPPLSVETDVTAFTLTNQTADAIIDLVDPASINIEVSNGTGLTGLTPTITLSDGATISPLSGVALDFDSGAVTYTVTAEDGITTKEYSVTVTEAAAPFAVFVNFQDEATTPPTGYSADFGLGFPANPLIGDYGWKKLDDGTSIDVNGANSAGRNRLGGAYAGSSEEEKLAGTMMHFQGDNIGSWSGQNRGNELYWELQVPNGIYEVTVGLGDRRLLSLDSRHTATLEGYTIIPAFRPTAGQVKVSTMIVEVTDGALTMNGLGGFNSKITHIEVVESTGTPVNGELVFTPNTASESIEAGASGSFLSILAGDGATEVALNIEDDPVNTTADNFNDWLSLPATAVPGDFTFGIDASTLVATDTRNNRIIATAAGFKPAILVADLTVTEGPPIPFAFIEDFDYALGNLGAVSSGAWAPENSNPDLPVVATSIATGAPNSLRIENDNTVLDYQTLINNPVNLQTNVPFYFGTYFKVEELGSNDGDRIRVALRVDDGAGEGTAWVRQMISRVGNGGPIKARLGLAGSSATPVGEVDVDPDQVLQFVVKGVWDEGTGSISYEYHCTNISGRR